MTDERTVSQVVAYTPGRPLAPDPVAASYDSEIPTEMYDLIDEMCPQDIAEKGTILERFKW